MIHQNRQVVREKIATLLEAALVGVGPTQKVQSVYSYQKERLEGESPVLVVISNGTNPLAANNPYDMQDFSIHLFVLYKDIGTGTQEAPEYSEQDSENDLDLISKQVMEVIEDNADKTDDLDFPWDELAMNASTIDSFTDVEGFEYRHETFPLRVSVLAQG